jgi:hypothetical protein
MDDLPTPNNFINSGSTGNLSPGKYFFAVICSFSFSATSSDSDFLEISMIINSPDHLMFAKIGNYP